MQKEQYFSPENIQTKGRELLAYVDDFHRRHVKSQIRLGKVALFVLDMQAYFLAPESHAFVPSAPVIVSGISKLVTAFTKRNWPIIFTRHINNDEDAAMMSTWWRDIIKPQSAYSHIVEQLEISNAIILNKSQYDAFFNTVLEETLRASNVEQVIITGVMTHLCCETTARSAFMRGFEVFFAVDGTATYNEALHQASLLTLSHGFATLILVDGILGRLQENES